MKKKNLAFTLAEVLIVIGIIGVVAALTLPNLNHATGDKETVTRLKKAYSILSEANDRAVAIYGPISSWSEECRNDLNYCWVKRVGEFLKISKSCNEWATDDSDDYVSCDSLSKGDMLRNLIYQLSDGITFGAGSFYDKCDESRDWKNLDDICVTDVYIDINGSNQGKNKYGQDIFRFDVSDSIGLIPYSESFANLEEAVSGCLSDKDYFCSFWPLEFGNLDYLKADSDGKCNDSNIILDGVTNTSCH